MKFLKDEAGQGAAEYILLFGGVIVTAILYKIFSHFHPIKVHDGHIIRWPY